MSERVEADWKWVRISKKLLPELFVWLEPVQVRVEKDVDNVLEMVFRRVPK